MTTRRLMHDPWLARTMLAALAVAFVVSGLYQAAHDSPTVDEAVDIASGISIVTRHDLRLSPEHDLLVHVLPALPALLAHPVIPDGPGYRRGDWFAHTDEFMRANRAAGKLNLIVFLARIVPLVEGLAVAGLLFGLARELVDRRSAVLSAGLWLSTPVFLGFSHVVSIDVTFTLAVLAVCLALAYDHRTSSLRSVVLVGLALGAALLARHSALVLVPAVMLVVCMARGRITIRSRAESVVVALVTAWSTVWVAFVVFGSSVNPMATGRFDGLIGSQRSHSVLVRVVLSVPWPKEWAAGLAYLAQTSTPRPAYLFGQGWVGGRWWFFPGSLLVKAPFGVIVILVLAPVGWWRLERAARRRMAVTLVPVALALVLELVVQPLDLGLRYAFPVVALGLVGAAPLARLLHGRWAGVAAGALAATQVLAMVAAGSHSLGWTPPPFVPGYRWASDSNIDYGQDERRVARWAQDKQAHVALLLPRGVDVPAGSRPLIGADQGAITGWVAVSATRLTVLDFAELSWLRAYCPTATIAGSVLVYRFATPPDLTPGPVMPAGPCHSTFSHRG